MEESIKFTHRTHEGKLSSVDMFNPETARKVQDFHKSFPDYQVTPLVLWNQRPLCKGRKHPFRP